MTACAHLQRNFSIDCLVLHQSLNSFTKLCLSSKQMSAAFCALTGPRGPGLRKDVLGLKEPEPCLPCCWLGLLGYVSLVGATNETAGKHTFYFICDVRAAVLSPSPVSRMTLRGLLREYFLLTYFMCWAEFTSCKISIKACCQTAYVFSFPSLVCVCCCCLKNPSFNGINLTLL